MTAMINHTPRWSHARGNTVVPSRWQATRRWPSWSDASNAINPAFDINVATVRRSEWLVIHS